MIALDSNVLIYFLTAHAEFGELSRRLLVAVEQTSLNACASELVSYEVLSYSRISDKEAREITSVLEELDVVYKPVSHEVLQLAAMLRRDHGCGAIDAIHIASAIAAKATHFVTNDAGILCKSIPDIVLTPLGETQPLLDNNYFT